MCVSIHYDKNNLYLPTKGLLYRNGKEIKSFITNAAVNHNSNMIFYLGSKNGNYGQIDGEILYVYVSTRHMKYQEIVLNHYLLCKKYGVDFNEDEILKYIAK